MRITNSLFFQNTNKNYQSTMKDLYDKNAQLSSGKKIQNGYEDSGIYVDTMRLDYEIDTLEQVKESSSKGQMFANNTDEAMNQFTETLDQFKTKLIQASNATNSPTSLNAIADELEGLRTHLINIANTSINGTFLFSGSATDIKPISDDGTYNGNDDEIRALIGSNSEIPYNISGKELFLGTDNDYSQVVSTNIPMYNQSKLHPDIMVQNSGVTKSEEVYLTSSDTIRDMVGDIDDSIGNDPKAVFYVSGRNSSGETFSDKIEIDTSSKVNDLLENIGFLYGNTPDNKVVDVSINDYGQIEVKDLNKGSLKLEMNIFGAIDRSASAGFSGGASAMSLDSLMDNENVQIIEFHKSDFKSVSAVDSVATSQRIYAPGEFTFGGPMLQRNGEPAVPGTKLQDMFGVEIDQITFGGTDNAGTALGVIPPLAITNSTTVSELMAHIDTEYTAAGVTVHAKLEDNGQLILNAGSNTDFSHNQFTASMTATDTTSVNEVQTVEITSDELNPASGGQISITLPATAGGLTYNVTPLDGETNDEIAMRLAALVDADANVNATTKDGTIMIEYTGVGPHANFGIANTSNAQTSNVVEEVAYSASRQVKAFSLFDGMNMQQRGLEKQDNELVSNVPQVIRDTNEYATSKTKLVDVAGGTVDLNTKKISLDGHDLVLDLVDKNGNVLQGEINLRDEGSYFKFDYNKDGVISANEIVPVFDGEGNTTPADEVTYQQIADIITLTMNGTNPIDSNTYDTNGNITIVGTPDGDLFNEYQASLKAAKNSVEVSLDDKGRWNIVDKNNSATQMELSIYDSRAGNFPASTNPNPPALSFMANDAVKVVDPNIDFFGMIDEIIEDVREGNVSLGDNPDDPRSLGIQNSLDRITHINDHVTKMQTQIGAFSNALQNSQERAELLSINVKTVQSNLVDTDIAEATLEFQQLILQYQAMMNTVSQINQLSLVNYM